MLIFKTNLALKSFKANSEEDSGPLQFVLRGRNDGSALSQVGHHYVFVSYKHYTSCKGRRMPCNLVSQKDVSRMAALLDVRPEQICLTSDREAECEEVKDQWWPQMVDYHRKIRAMFLTEREMTQEHMLKFWFTAELLAAKEAGCAIICGKRMASIVKSILEYVPDINAVKRLVARGSLIDNSQAPGEIITPHSISEARIEVLEVTEASERDGHLVGSLKDEPCFESSVREGIGGGALVAVRSHVAGVTLDRHILYREETTPNLYVKPDAALCKRYLGDEDVLISTPIAQLQNEEYLRFDSDARLTSRFADNGTLERIGQLSVCLIGDLAARVFNTGSIDGTVWVSEVYLDGKPHIKVDTVSVNFNDPHDKEVNKFFLRDEHLPRIARSFKRVEEMSYFDIVSLSRTGMNLKGSIYKRAVAALVNGKTAELSAVLGKDVEIGSYSGGITSLYDEGRVGCILAYLSLKTALKDGLQNRALAKSNSDLGRETRSLWFEKGVWLVDHGRSRVECVLVAIAVIAITLAIVFIARRSDVASDRKIELSSIVIAALVTLLVEGGSLLTGERVDLRRVATGKRAIRAERGAQFLTAQLNVQKSVQNGVRLDDIRAVLSNSKACIFGECRGRVRLQRPLTLKEIAELGYKFGTDSDNRVVAQHAEMERGTIMVLTKTERRMLHAREESGHMLKESAMIGDVQDYFVAHVEEKKPLSIRVLEG